MSTYRNLVEYSFDYPASTVTRANGGYSATDTEVVGRWVQMQGNVPLLVGDDVRPDGIIKSLGATKVGIAFGPILTGKQSGDTVIPAGRFATGATRTVTNGGTPERGFVKALPASLTTVAHAVSAKGRIINSGTNTADTEGEANTDVLMW